MRKTKVEQILGASCFILLLQAVGHVQAHNPAFNDQHKLHLPESYIIDWMRNLDGNKLLFDIILPGTHDTMALHGGPPAGCQAWSLEDQLRAGICYLDLRVFALENTLYLMHGTVYQRSTFFKVLDTIRTFLSTSPSETVLVWVKPDLTDKNKIQPIVEKLIENDDQIWVQSTIPRLDQARGKIVFVQKDSFKLGAPLSETDTKSDYEVVHIKDKETEILGHLNQAMTECEGLSVILTYSSGTGISTIKGMFLTPKRVAEKINPWLCDYL